MSLYFSTENCFFISHSKYSSPHPYLHYRSDARYNGNAFVTRLNAVTNAFTRGGKRAYTRLRTRLHADANEFTRGQVGVYTMRQTSLHAIANAFTRGGKRAYTRLQTRLRAEVNEIARGCKRVRVIPCI